MAGSFGTWLLAVVFPILALPAVVAIHGTLGGYVPDETIWNGIGVTAMFGGFVGAYLGAIWKDFE